MEFLQAISITGWGRESCAAFSTFFKAYVFLLLCFGLLEMLSALELAEIFVSILSQFQI